MGLALPLRGYILPRGQRTVINDPDSSWNRQAREAIHNFAETIRQLAPSLKPFIYPALGSSSELLDIDVVVETDRADRPGLQQLIESITDEKPGSIVVANLSHLKWSSEYNSQQHRQLLDKIVQRTIPVFTLWPGESQSLANQMSRAGDDAYFVAADNYAHNRQSLERHLQQFADVS